MNRFAERLRLAMNRANMKPVELCEKTGIGKSSISQYMSGEYEPKQKKLYLLAEALAVSPSYLMGLTDDPVNYDDEDLIASVQGPRLDYFDGDVEKAVAFDSAVLQDVLDRPATIALSRADNPYDDLPEEAQQEIENFIAYTRQKYKKQD